MILYYAMGGGLGHLVRARAVLHTLRLERRVALLSASPHTKDARVVGDLPVYEPPAAIRDDTSAVGAWVVETITRLAPSELIVDAFPAGLLGELRLLRAPPPSTYVARLLRWSAYAPLAQGSPLRFTRALVVEELHPAHAAFTAGAAASVDPLTLVDPPAPTLAAASLPPLPARFSLVVHAGADAEIAELVAYARDLAQRDAQLLAGAPEPVLVCRPGGRSSAIAGTSTVDLHPPAPLFAHATRIVTACGFNVMRQLAPFGAKHHFLPFARRYDDQYTRAARARRARLHVC
jgi:hypothetical protein